MTGIRACFWYPMTGTRHYDWQKLSDERRLTGRIGKYFCERLHIIKVMNIQTLEYGLDADQIKDLLARYQITPTRQRLEIAQHMFQRPQHLSAEKILEGVNRDGHRVSRATVYNTMGLFASKGLVREVLIDRERVFYDSNNSAHHHIYNLDTGELYDVDGASLEIGDLPGLAENLKVVDTDLIIRVSQRQEK